MDAITADDTSASIICSSHENVSKTPILGELQDDILTTENIQYVYKNVEHSARKELDDVPDLIKKKRIQRERLQLEINNYLG